MLVLMLSKAVGTWALRAILEGKSWKQGPSWETLILRDSKLLSHEKFCHHFTKNSPLLQSLAYSP